jgi:hypothetical protein
MTNKPPQNMPPEDDNQLAQQHEETTKKLAAQGRLPSFEEFRAVMNKVRDKYYGKPKVTRRAKRK